MKLRTKYILFVSILHLVALVLSYFIFHQYPLLFIVSEIFIVISAIVAAQLYKQLIQPLKLLVRGTEAIKDRDFNVKFLATGKFEMDQLIGMYNQMIEELRSERVRQEQQHLFLEKLIYTSPTGILILDYDENIQQVNPKALQLLATVEKEILQQPVHAVVHPILQQVKLLTSGTAKTFTMNGAITYKIQKSHFIDRGFPRYFIMIEELTAEILEAEKKTYGKIIRMMAHEVNNTVGPVNSILQFTLKSASPGAELSNALQIAIERNDNLNSFMRNYAELVRIPLPVRKSIDVYRLLQNTTGLMQLRAGEKNIRFVFEEPVDNFIIDADLLQMEQATINIIKNAIEAIDEEGIITISISNRPKQLVVRNTGKGISPETEAFLFSPFFSTKKDGQGIGLIVIRDILMNHGFSFSLKTIIPGVTEFRIYFE